MNLDLSAMHFGPAAGMIKTVPDVVKAARSLASVIPVGSITQDELVGNAGQNETALGNGDAYLNALGLPNAGLEAYVSMLPTMRSIAEGAGKLLLPSVAGFCVREYVTVTAALAALGFRAIKLNLGCPNVRDAAGAIKPIASFDRTLMCAIMGGCAEILPPGSTLYLKMSPYTNPLELTEVAQTIVELAFRFRHIRIKVVTSNTFPNCMAFNPDGRPAINAKTTAGAPVTMGGGSGGDLFRAIAVGQVGQFVTTFANRRAAIGVIGVGGIVTAEHAREYWYAGAEGIEVGSGYRKYGPRVLEDIALGV